MNGLDEPIVYKPEGHETLKVYLQKYSEDEIQRIIQHPEKRIAFCEILKERPQENSKEIIEIADKKLREILRNTENYMKLLHHVEIWEPTRQKLLDILTKCSKDLNRISKLSSYGRILGCAIESYCTIKGLCDSKPNALQMATYCGALGIGITLAGAKISYDSFYQLTKLMQIDQRLFAPIQSWFQQNEELENAMNNVFSFDFTKLLMKEITDIVEKRESLSPVNLLSRLLKGLSEKCKGSMKYSQYIEYIISFVSYQPFKDYCEWIFIQEENQVMLNGLKMLLQYYKSDLTYLVCQSVRALAPADQNLTSLPVLGRLGLNGLSIISDTWRLRRFEVPGVVEMRNLEKHIKRELGVVKKYVAYLNDINKKKDENSGEHDRTAENGPPHTTAIVKIPSTDTKQKKTREPY